LIEVLVAMTIMAIMAVMAWQGVDGIVRARDASNERLEKQLRLNTVLAQWEQDLLNIQDTYLVDALKFDGSTLRLTRRTPAGMQVVAWSVRGNSWTRWAGQPVTTGGDLQNSWLRTQQLLGNESGQLRVAGGVTGWQIYFYQGNAWANAQSTGDVTPDAATAPASGASSATSRAVGRTALPAGVRLVMTFNGEGLNGTLTRDIVLGPQPR
jgi:general secretion pathway protein J